MVEYLSADIQHVLRGFERACSCFMSAIVEYVIDVIANKAVTNLLRA
jgi:hypothetical protein